MGWTVLCVSKISAAQVTRNMILERAGYKVIAIANPDEAARAFAASPIHAVIFGDSIQADRRIELARTIKRLDPSVPIIALSKTSGSQFPAGIVDEQLESLGDPRLLLDALQRALGDDVSVHHALRGRPDVDRVEGNAEDLPEGEAVPGKLDASAQTGVGRHFLDLGLDLEDLDAPRPLLVRRRLLEGDIEDTHLDPGIEPARELHVRRHLEPPQRHPF